MEVLSMEKYDRGMQIIDEGGSNADVVAALKAEYGSGVGSSIMAKWRATSSDRIAEGIRAKRKATIAAVRTAKRALVKEMLSDGHSGYAAQQACLTRFQSGVGNETIVAMREELAAEQAEAPVAAPETPVEASQAIVPVELPPEMLEPEPEPSTALEVVEPHGPNGTLTSLKAVQSWMTDINAEHLSLSSDGKLSVLVRHEYDLGVPE
jgi:hypothetical protein